MVKTQFLYLCLSACLFVLMSNHNSWTPRSIWIKFLFGELGRTSGIFLAWFQNSKSWADWLFLGKTTGKAGYVILIKEDYTILNIYTQERKRKSKELSFCHKIKFKNSKALYYVWMQRYGNMKFFFCCKNSVPLLYFHRHCNNYFSYQ